MMNPSGFGLPKAVMLALIIFRLATLRTYGIANSEGQIRVRHRRTVAIEPRSAIPCSRSTSQNCGSGYRVPIQISIHDANHLGDDLYFNYQGRYTATGLGDLISVEVSESIFGLLKRKKTYFLHDLHEVEYTKNEWPCAVTTHGEPCRDVPFSSDHLVCRA